MKTGIVLLFSLLIVLLLTACAQTPQQTTARSTAPTTSAATTVTTSTTTTAASTTTASLTAESTTPTETSTAPAETVETTTETTAAPTATPTEPTTTAATTSETGPGPVNTVSLYSSFAYMVSYDPARGWADFDYFNMLRGDDAVQWLVEREGYSLADAQEEVDNFGDSQYIEQNDNPQLRTIDLSTVHLKLMYYPDGSESLSGISVDSELIDLYNLYHLDPDLVLNSYFYYVEVEDGIPVAVRQVFWP